MSNVVVSIVMPFRNTAPFLTECLNSMLTQTYPDWELIAVDDHSTDDSRTLLNSYAYTYSNIKVFPNQGRGIIKALQTGYKASSGAFITRMDSDDIMTPNKLKVMLDALVAKGKGHLAVGQVRYFSEKGVSEGYARYEKWLNTLTEKGNNYDEIYKECVIPSPCWMAYKTDLERCNAFNPNRYPEDYDLAFRFYENHLKCIPCAEVLHLWRDYSTRTSRTSAHYAQNYFLDIKLRYFLKLDYEASRPLVIWGAGNKGKRIAKMLTEHRIAFYWICNNPNKVGKTIYGCEMLHFSALDTLAHPQSIITVANRDSQQFIHHHLRGLGQSSMTDFFFFC